MEPPTLRDKSTFQRRLRDLHSRMESLRVTVQGEVLLHREDLLTDLQTAIEELNAAEEELHQQGDQLIMAQARIEREHLRYRELFDDAPDAYLVTDPGGVVTEVNRRACELLGIEAKFLVRKPLASFFTGRDLQEFLSTLNGLKSNPGKRDLRLELRSRRGPLDAGITVASTTDAAGQGMSLRWMIRDVTAEVAEQHVLERAVSQRTAELRSALDRAEQASRAKDRFLAMLSHELRTPLTPALALVDAVQSEGDLPRQAKQDLAVLRRNLLLEARLIDDLLDLNCVAQGKLQLWRENLDIHPLLEQVVAICQEEARARSVSIHVSAGADRHHVEGDAARLQQVIWNVLRNAIKFSPERGSISLATFNDSSENLVIEIRDEGAGIPPHMLPSIFDAFEQGDAPTARSRGGLGLGLAISKMLVSLHGGAISAASDGVGAGACFTIRLPAIAAPADHASQEEEETPALNGRARNGIHDVLLVEDNPDTLNALSRLLARHGFNVRSASTLAEARAFASRAPVDLLISDLGLPDGNGTELMLEMHNGGAPTAGIALSGFGMEHDARRSLEAGFSRHLTKPVPFDTLLAAIEELPAPPEPSASTAAHIEP